MTERPTSAWPPPHPGTAAWITAPSPTRGVPAVVQAAVIVTYVCSALVAAATAVMALGAVLVDAAVLRYFEPHQRLGVAAAVAGGTVVVTSACALACWLAWSTGRRKVWARFALAICSALVLVASVVALTPVSAVVVPGSTAALVLLFLPQSNAWFRTAREGA